MSGPVTTVCRWSWLALCGIVAAASAQVASGACGIGCTAIVHAHVYSSPEAGKIGDGSVRRIGYPCASLGPYAFEFIDGDGPSDQAMTNASKPVSERFS